MSLPGMNPPIAAFALGSLLTTWTHVIQEQRRGVITQQDPDAFLFAAILICHESPKLVKGTCNDEVEQCLRLAEEGDWAFVETIPWTLVKSYLETGIPDPIAIANIELGLANDMSQVRLWFHYVAWMIRSDLNAEPIRRLLLRNLADKLAGLEESAGLLAALHPDKGVLDQFADSFVPPKGFEAQYRSRIEQTRAADWNYFAQHYWIVENKCRKLIWETVKSEEGCLG